MNTVYLCGHTGSMNRGCEAIIRGTAEVFKSIGIDNIEVLTFDEKYDKMLGLDKAVRLTPYPKKSFIIRLTGKLLRDIFKNGTWGHKYSYKPLFKGISTNDIVFNVGGDTYCYDTPYLSMALNELAQKNGIKNVFWGCSVEENVLSNTVLKKDINRYSYIVSRETLSYETLVKCTEDRAKVFLACDPAFHLPITKTELPKLWNNNVVGINISPLVIKDANNSNDIIYQNVYTLIEYIINQTDMNICLIPHVYNIENNLQDIAVLKRIYSRYSDTNRVSIVDSELSCTELKFIISRCRFFIGARTHATIAAYSTGVPTIALSYSVKSLGIAQDLFGKQEGYVIRHKNITDENELKNAFINTLLNNENAIRERYKKILPEYKQSIIDVTRKIIGN